MLLSEWLAKKKVTRIAFSKRIGVSASYITGLCDGTYWPGRDVMNRIITATDGMVTADDFLQGAA